MGRRLVVLLGIVALVTGAALPAAAAEKVQYERTECIYPAAEPDLRLTGNPPVQHFRDFQYFGILTEDGVPAGTNAGSVDIDFNRNSGSGSIRGTLGIADDFMGQFEGRFSGHYQAGIWEGRGNARGVGDQAGELMKIRVQGLDPADCPQLESPFGPLDAVDAAFWAVEVIAR